MVFDQLAGSTDAVRSLLLATGYLRVLKFWRAGERKRKVYTLALTNMEVASMFEDMVKGWFNGNTKTYQYPGHQPHKPSRHANVSKHNTD